MTTLDLAPQLPTFSSLGNRMESLCKQPVQGWSYDFEEFEHTSIRTYWVYDEYGQTVCRAMSQAFAERIVADHNSAANP